MGSEMCIRDRISVASLSCSAAGRRETRHLAGFTLSSPPRSTPAMCTFGVTFHGPPNGQANLNLSLFNMDHPLDRAWLKKSFDTVCTSGKLTTAHVRDFLSCFYRHRVEGATNSGAFVHAYPSSDADFLFDLVANSPKSFEELLDAIMQALDHNVQPAAPTEYVSHDLLRTDMERHVRKVLNPQQQFRAPQTTSQEVGWEVGLNPPAPIGKPFHLRTSATTQFMDAAEKNAWGRSIVGEFSAYAAHKLLENGGFGMGI